MIKDLTKGNPFKVLFYFALPMLLGNVFQQFYNIVDSVIVGNFVSADALAAVGASFPIMFLFVSVASGTSMGSSVVISQLFGAKKIKEMKNTISTALIFVTAFGFIVMIVGGTLSKPLLILLQTPTNIMADSIIYLQIYFGGAVFLFLYNTLAAIYNALGDSKSPLKFLIFATIINVILDYSFVVYFHMGVAGVAWATLIAQGISAVISFAFMMKKLKNIDGKGDKLFDKEALKNIVKIAVPSIIQQSLVSVGMMAMQGLVNSNGSSFVAGYTAATKLDTIAMMPVMNIGNALSTYTAQNIGAGKIKRIKEGYKAALKMSFLFCLCITIIIYLFGNQLIGMFVDSAKSMNVISYGVEYLKVVSVFYIIMGVMFTTNGVLRGSGDVNMFVLSSMGNLVSRILGAYSLNHFIGASSIWWSIPIGWVTGAMISIIRYSGNKWQNKAIVNISSSQRNQKQEDLQDDKNKFEY